MAEEILKVNSGIVHAKYNKKLETSRKNIFICGNGIFIDNGKMLGEFYEWKNV